MTCKRERKRNVKRKKARILERYRSQDNDLGCGEQIHFQRMFKRKRRRRIKKLRKQEISKKGKNCVSIQQKQKYRNQRNIHLT